MIFLLVSKWHSAVFYQVSIDMQSWPPPYLQWTETNKESGGDRGVNWSCFERMSSDNNVHI